MPYFVIQFRPPFKQRDAHIVLGKYITSLDCKEDRGFALIVQFVEEDALAVEEIAEESCLAQVGSTMQRCPIREILAVDILTAVNTGLTTPSLTVLLHILLMLIPYRRLHNHIRRCPIKMPPRMIHVPISVPMLSLVPSLLVSLGIRLKQQASRQLVGVAIRTALELLDHVGELRGLAAG